MNRKAILFGALLAAATVIGCQQGEGDDPMHPAGRGGPVGGAETSDPAVPDSAEAVRPLARGEAAPAAVLRQPDGQPVDLAVLYKSKPTVLIFYRGGWCPYCNAHLSEIATAEPELLSLGYQVVAVSPDRPEELARTLDKQHLSYRLLSDSDGVLGRAFGLMFRVDDATLERYSGFGIDLEQASGRGHHMLPVPAVYVVDMEGIIRFAHWDADYRTRLASEVLLREAREVVRSFGAGGGEPGR